MKFLSLFTGIGGLESGLEKLGAECVGYSEIKESSVRIYDKNHPGRKNFGDITKIKPGNLPDFDMLTGGFPCQSFSLAGLQKGFKDKRGLMIFYIYDILIAKKPEYVVLENVRGIAFHDNGKTMRNVIRLLTYAGYNVRVLLLRASNYGSAQGRDRVFFLCAKKNFPLLVPEIIDNTKTFRDIRDKPEGKDFYSDRVVNRIELNEGAYGFLFIGGYDRVNTLTTSVSSSGMRRLVVQEKDGRWRKITCTEAERLQGFPDGYTVGESKLNRWYALGNAVSCNVSDYLFTNYLKKLWRL